MAREKESSIFSESLIPKSPSTSKDLDLSPNFNEPKPKPRRLSKKYLAIISIALVVIVFVASVEVYLAAPQNKPYSTSPPVLPGGASESIPLGLNYTIGEQMVYKTTNVITNPVYNPGGSQSYNFTTTKQVVDFNGENYTINTKTTYNGQDAPLTNPIAINVNVSKTQYYDNFMAPGGPAVFLNASTNPTISAYLASNTVKVGDVWHIPVNTGNETLGMTGNLTLTFGGIQNLTVPAGTYTVFEIEVQSSPLTTHVNMQPDYLNLNQANGTTVTLSGQTFLEYGTCRLIKADLQQETTLPSGGTATMYTEQILQEHTVP